MDWYHSLLGLLSSDASFTLDGVQYPAGTLRMRGADWALANGFLPVQLVGSQGDPKFYTSTQLPPRVENGLALVEWQTTPKDLTQIQGELVGEVKTQAARLIQASGVDWKLSRAEQQRKLRQAQLDQGVPEAEAQVVQEVPAELLAYAQAIRDVGNVREAEVLAAGSIEVLASLPSVEWPQV